MRRLCYRYQRTLTRAAEVRGVGFLTGATVRLRFLPAPAGTGVVFRRTDLHPAVSLPARIDQVTGTQRRTILGTPPAHVGLVEHVLSALFGLRIDNCYVEVDAPEPPGLDGSARDFVQALRGAGVQLQAARKAVWTVASEVVVTRDGANIAIHPAAADELRVSYTLHYRLPSPIGRQTHTQLVTPARFAAELADCRTYIFAAEADELRRQGLGARTTAADLLVFGANGPIDNQVRHANEPARHKILDILGDLSLCGLDLRGHVVAYRSGHTLNVELVRALARRLLQRFSTRKLAA